MTLDEMPLWAHHPGVQQLLNFVVDRLDNAEARGTVLSQRLKLDGRSFPALYQAEFESEKEELWDYVRKLETLGWIRLSIARAQLGQAPYERTPRLEVVDGDAIRTATGRGCRVASDGEMWREVVRNMLDLSDEARDVASRYRIDIPGKDPYEIADRLRELPALAGEPLLLREVSARLFWGLSKVLDGRQALVAAVLGADECPFPEMPVQLQVFLSPSGFDGVLFIENQSTYEQATRDDSGRFARLALVFAYGFRGAARRLRTEHGASVYFAAHGTLAPEPRDRFLGWLRGGEDLPSWFWGDLDYAGMAILKGLRTSFPKLEAWRPGYSPMLDVLQAGGGHAPDQAGKTGQRMAVQTGCPFADHELLPRLLATGRFVDQELT